MPVSKKSMSGVGMVEVLVAVVIIGVGMLGIASLYVTTLQAKTTALSRMQAVALVNDMADRIRANRVVSATAYAVAETSTVPPTAPSPSCVTNSASAPGTNCTADQLAAYDLYLWAASVSGTLPGTVKWSIAATDATATTPKQYMITVKWTEPLTGNSTAGVLSYAMQVQI